MGWILNRPVHRNQQSSRGPQIKLGCVVGKLTNLFRADQSFPNTLARNPAYNHKDLDTWWCDRRRKGFGLDQLDVAEDRREPAVLLQESAVGRNVALFEGLMRFAGSWSNRDADLWERGSQINNLFDFPLPNNEVRSTVRSVERYRSNWIAQGRYYDHGSEAQSERGIRSGAARRRAVVQRDVEILRMRLEGAYLDEIVAEMGISWRTVQRLFENSAKLKALYYRLDKSEKWAFVKRFGAPRHLT